MRTRASTLGSAFSAYFTILKTINLLSPGNHTIEAYTFIHCGATQCAASTDSISIKLKEDNGPYREIFYAGYKNGRIKDKQWILQSVNFQTITTQISVRI